MYLACIECFRVIGERPPVGDAGVIPIICPPCQKLEIQAQRTKRRHKASTSKMTNMLSTGNAMRLIARKRAAGRGTIMSQTDVE